ncbi:MAG: PrsW family intramembrane metalloprotease [Lachnospiraceae bacterium]|nr:PrsW family intramembrane metalloprotease [Lachnospiraceae bacterium]
MNYIENIYICIAAPILVAILAMSGANSNSDDDKAVIAGSNRKRVMIFLLVGMTICLLSSYISTYFALVLDADRQEATWEITPLVEEVMKFFPILFYILVFEPEKREESAVNILAVAVGFATLENICYLTANGAEDIVLLAVRGFGTGVMHVVCGELVYIGFVFLWDEFWLRFAGISGLISLAATYHAIYNILVSQDGFVAWIGYLVPMVTALLMLYLRRRMSRIKNKLQPE